MPGASVLPTRAPNVRRVSATRPMYNLLKGGHLGENDGRVFVCPSASGSRPMLAEDYSKFTDFVEPGNVSYSFLFMNLPEGRHIEKMHLKMVLVSDRNPLLDPGAGGHDLDPFELNNSTMHKTPGQNVLYIGGNGGWATTPRVGVEEDDIFRAGSISRYQGTEIPTSETDTWVVP
jgi:hypothetical protein